MGLLPRQRRPTNSNSHPFSLLRPQNSNDSSSASSSSSLSSQSSLPSVPSLTSQPPLSHPPAAHHLSLATLRAHPSYVSSLALAGNSLLSASSDGQVRSWSRHQGHDLRNSNTGDSDNIVAVMDSAVKSMAVLGDHRLITAHQDHKIRVWKMASRSYTPVAELPTVADRLARMFSAKNYVVVRRHKKCMWVHHVDAVSALALSPDRALLYSVSWDRTLKVWRTSDFRCLESIDKAHDDAINAVVVGQDGIVYTGSADTKIKVWARRMAEGKARGVHGFVAALEKHRSAVNALALSVDGRVLYSGACDRSILVWERAEDDDTGGGGPFMVVVGALRGHGEAILCLAVVSDLVVSGSADKAVRIWRREQGRCYSCLAVMEGHERPVKCVAAALAAAGDDDGSSGCSYMVYSGALDCSVKVWQVWVHPV